MNILVTGGSGAVGPCIIHVLHQAGYQIRSFSIDTPASGMFPQNVEVLIGDVTDKAAVQSAMQGVDVVVHMAALLHIVNPPPELRERYELVNIGGTRTVVEAAINAGVKRIILFSTIAVYGASGGQVLDEMSATKPETFYAQTKLTAEQIILNARGVDGQPLGTVLRLGAVYGSRIKGNYERLLYYLARHRFIPVGSGLNRRTLVYDKDVARAAILALEHPFAAGKVFNVSDGEFHTMNDIISIMCQALGRKPPCFYLPVGPVRFAAGIFEDVAKFLGRQPQISRALIDKFTEDVAVDSRQIQRELGFVPQYNLSAGWRDSIKEMRRSGISQC
jgi:UDP-glucose 4-epimerase